MKQFCIKSGIVIKHDTVLDNLGLDPIKLNTPSIHPVFSYPLVDIISMATSKPHQNLTTNQRHLLALAILDRTGVVSIQYPIMVEELEPEKLLKLFPMIVEIGVRIVLNYQYWEDSLDLRPRIELRADNKNDVNIFGYIKNILFQQSAELLLPRSTSRLTQKESRLLDEEIDFEVELKRKIAEHNSNTKTNNYTITMGKYVLKELSKEIFNTTGHHLKKDFQDLALYILATNPEKLSTHKATYKQVKHLREMIVTHIPISIAPEDTLTRAYTAIVVKHLDDKLDYYSSVAAIFGAITEKVPAKLGSAYPLEYSVVEVNASPFDSGVLSIPTKNKNLKNSSSSLVQRLLAKRVEVSDA